MKRRDAWMLAGAGAAALAAGAGWQFRSRQRDAADAAVAALWTLSFPEPGGGQLEMAALRGAPLLLNFWATWCAPCIKEMPDLDAFARSHAAWRVVGLAIDGPTPVREFLTKRPVGYRIALAGFEGTELVRSLGNANGGLPFTVLFDASGRIVQRKLGQTRLAELEGWARGI